MKPSGKSPSDPSLRAAEFLDAYYGAENNTPIDVGIGRMGKDGIRPEDGEPCVIISINSKVHGFSVTEARALAQAGEMTMNTFKEVFEDDTSLPDLILALRHAADEAEKLDDKN